ncbi:MAG: LysR family transcriptional regulator [Oscillospiraceae bacterium]|nr:LysR family transcriptional regulator [Oscillospiraceae bacterium]
MELRVLNYFLMVAREENITKAAQLLHITQPTLSRQLMQLEEELGVKLFDRSSHRIILTSEGMLLKRRAQEMVTLAERTRSELEQKEETLSGLVAVGSGELQSVNELSRLIADFREIHPLVTFDIYSGNAEEIKSRIANGTLDIGLLLEPVDTSKYEFIRLNTREQWGILAPENSDIAKKEFVTSNDLAGLPLITTASDPIQHELSSWFGDNAKQMNVVSVYNLLYNSAIMVQNGVGIALCLRLNCSYDGLSFVPLYPKLEFSSVLTWKDSQVFSPATTAFIDFIKKCPKGIM